MQRSTRAFASAELAPTDRVIGPLMQRRVSVRAVLASISGKAGFGLLLLTLGIALIGPRFVRADPFALSGPPLARPSLAYVLGTDALGRDLLSGVVFGARTSLSIACAVTSLAAVCGVIIGLIAGYRGGFVDDMLSRTTELFQVLPRLFLVAVVIALFGTGVNRIVLTLGLTSWPVLARVVRGEILSAREADFVLAAQALGASSRYIAWRVLLPHVLPSVVVILGILFGQALLIESSLGFLGLSDPSTLTWGLLVEESQGFVRVAWWLTLFPGLAITVAILAFNLLADAFSTAAGRT